MMDDADDRPDRGGETGRGSARKMRRVAPLDAAQLDALALAYVARFATSAGKLGAYCERKLRERGWAGDAPPDVSAIVARMVALGYVDDAGFARMRGAGLLRRGFGAGRIAQDLARARIAPDLADEASGSERERRAAALAFARRKRLGPFARAPFGGHSGAGCSEPGCLEDDTEPRAGADRGDMARQIAAFQRAGHSLASARALIAAADAASAEEWVNEASDS